MHERGVPKLFEYDRDLTNYQLESSMSEHEKCLPSGQLFWSLFPDYELFPRILR